MPGDESWDLVDGRLPQIRLKPVDPAYIRKGTFRSARG